MVTEKVLENKISFYNQKLWDKIIVLPDVIVESEGLACGDKVKITLSVIDNQYYFSIVSEGCNVCTAICNFLVDELYGKEETTIYSFIDRLLNAKYNDRDKWLEAVPLERKLCLLTPIKLLKEAIVSSKPKCLIENETNLLACDACISSFQINWEGEDDDEATGKKSIFDLYREVSKIADPIEMKYQRLGKSILLESEVKELVTLMNDFSKAKYKIIKRLRLPMLYYNNLTKYGQSIMSNDLMLLCKKQIISKEITRIEIEKINDYIKEKKWKISKVKGARTSDYYEKQLFRTHLDYDYIASNIEDGFHFINYLINVNGFKFVAGGSVPFSLKVVDDYDGLETLTGHLHLEKIIQDSFQIVIDINLGGFPLGRTGVVKLNELNIVSIEDQFIITLCHIFKHEIVYMKDVNDMYYMIKSNSINYSKLHEMIVKNGLETYYYFLMKYISENYDISNTEANKYDSFKHKVIYFLNGKQWPYSRETHFWIKFYELFARSKNKNGYLQGFKEVYKQCIGMVTEGIPTQKYYGINVKKNTRTYLYPAVLFNKTVSFDMIDGNPNFDEIIKKCIYRFKGYESNIIITTFGVFIAQENIKERNIKSKITNEVKEVLDIMQLKTDCINQNYIMQARQDLWLY